MRRNLRYAAGAVALGMIPVAIALYEFFLAPATAQGGVVIPPRLWYTLCAFAPALVPLLSTFEAHHWPGGSAFALLLILSNALIYGLCGFLIAFAVRKLIPAHPSPNPQPRASH